ncbi:ROK family protein [Mucilaginibacter ginkgonis]|uniref:ROK family protein n=1 Tax=Mucilaginibacter ginkgonis TaxID=2682091 RepID=A0A6I4HUC8_9SPHI|nr:ROK family protein [Mucilaginibacter ginkgonis]QQL50307.1 ROK family protein [Mucilaginibacter ginkgonis]
MSSKLIIGVDGGATKTQMAVANTDGELLNVHTSGGTYYILENAQQEMNALLAPIANSEVAVAVFTVAGWDFKPDQEKQQRVIEEAIRVNNISIDKIIYENDVFSTLKSAKDVNGACVVISCGTGVIGLAAKGNYFCKTPGYEYLSGEWGSGIHQAEYGIHLACASLLGRGEEYAILTQKALAYFEATDADSLAFNIFNKFTTNKQRGYFLKEIYDAYHEGCPGAAKVINRAAEELARTAWCLIKKLNKPDHVNLIFGGGVIKQFGLPPGFNEWLQKLTGRNDFKMFVIKSAPVYGALRWALAAAEVSTTHILPLLICNPVSYGNYLQP